jgi:hypothetical protein
VADNLSNKLPYLVYRDGMQTNRAAQVVDNVQALLTSTGASRRGTAQASGIAPETFQRRLVSVGSSPFTVTELEQLAKHFGVTIHSLVCCSQDSDAA